MPLSEELKQAAIDLGNALANSSEMQDFTYLQGNPEGEALYEQKIEVVKALFSRTSQRMSTTMGIRYTDFVK